MEVHLVDGTYELFRSFYGAPPALDPKGREVGATRGILRTLAALLSEATHVAIAFDTVIESFRNELFDGYKTGEGIEPTLHAQFPLAERAAAALGITVWPMIDFEADDALATGAARFKNDPRVSRVIICTPDKDVGQCLGPKVVRLDRRQRKILDEEGLRDKLGIGPASVPDWLALVGDTADGIPGIPRWGEKSASAVLGTYPHLEAIPDAASSWHVKVRGADALATNLAANREAALLYRKLATLREDVPLQEDVDALEWRGVRAAELSALLRELGDESFRPPTR